jgi:preprotein translocase subunit SecE
MARIQKKKTAHNKKKQQDGSVAEAVAAKPGIDKAGSAGRGSGVSISNAGADKKKKKILALKKPSGSDQSAVIKFADKHFGKWTQFFREVKVELLKVTWPSKKQTIGSTAVVIVFVFIIAFFLGLIDISLSSLVRLIL